MVSPLHCLVAATHTPFDSGGELRLEMVEKQAAHLLATGVGAVFIGGTTGESASLTCDERLALAGRWGEVVRGTPLRLIVHVGGNCLADARTLAAHAQSIGAGAISALAPSYFKPAGIGLLVDCCANIASAAPEVPFYYYDIPVLTGVQFPMPAFLDLAAERIPSLVGLKFTNPDLMAYQRCLANQGGRFDVPWGTDECLLAALAVGARGTVGSTYNFAAPIYVRLMQAFARGDLAAARVEQYRSVQIVQRLATSGFMASAKAVMRFLGVDVGPARLPHANLDAAQVQSLRVDLETMGFFEWVR